MSTRMFYFGPWNRAGHYLIDERGMSVRDSERGSFPWNEWSSGDRGIDGRLQPWSDGTFGENKRYNRQEAPEGVALIHHKGGWTALSFWDRSVDTRGGCNSNYFAEGTFTFDEMVAMAKERFAYRWNKQRFQVVPAPQTHAPSVAPGRTERMSWGMCICSTCKREVHQDGPMKDGRRGWTHCENSTPMCDGARADYVQTLSEVKGKWCGCDGKPGESCPW